VHDVLGVEEVKREADVDGHEDSFAPGDVPVISEHVMKGSVVHPFGHHVDLFLFVTFFQNYSASKHSDEFQNVRMPNSTVII